jgi:membrane-bound serine protease (ClpP class)
MISGTKDMIRTKRILWLWLIALTLALVNPAGAAGSRIRLLSIEGPVTPAMISYFERGIATAKREGDEALVIQLDTPGGQGDLMLDIVQLFRSSEVPIIVYIAPRGAQAASAGTIITLAAHAAVMAPETTIGAASPVGPSGEDLGETMQRKVQEDLKATARGLAERRGEEAVTLAEATIAEAKAVHANEALAAGLIDLVADDLTQLLEGLDGLAVQVNEKQVVLSTAGATVLESPLNTLERLMHTVVNPTIVTVLMAIGVQAILIELSSPGGWVAGFVGVICLGLGFYGLGVLPVNWLGLGLIGVAFVLFILDIKAPTHGALTVAGVLTLIAGFLITFNYPESPAFARVSVPLVVSVALAMGGFFAFALAKVLRARKRQPSTGAEALVGSTAKVRSPLMPTGTVLMKGELWQAVSADDSDIPKGSRVEVIAVQGFLLHVRSLEEGTPASDQQN